MAWQGGDNVKSYTVGTGGVTAGLAVRLGSSGDAGKVIAISAIDQPTIGVARETVAAGGTVDVALAGCKAKMVTGTGGLTSGDLVAADATGKAVKATPANTTTATAFHYFFGTAEETVAAGETATVELTGLSSYVNTTDATL